MEKMEAHRKALLHKAVSVFIVNSAGEWLLQRRAQHKYHSGGLWTNSCCTHPYPNESSEASAKRRLQQEMGMNCDRLEELFGFIYKEPLDNELTEHEYDRVFWGKTDNVPDINPEEVAEYKYIAYPDLKNDVNKYPENYTVWFRLIFERVYEMMCNR
jgi:isopentenyl-diphosphate delta-isomerase